jgi:hypothetical protein
MIFPERECRVHLVPSISVLWLNPTSSASSSIRRQTDGRMVSGGYRLRPDPIFETFKWDPRRARWRSSTSGRDRLDPIAAPSPSSLELTGRSRRTHRRRHFAIRSCLSRAGVIIPPCFKARVNLLPPIVNATNLKSPTQNALTPIVVASPLLRWAHRNSVQRVSVHAYGLPSHSGTC